MANTRRHAVFAALAGAPCDVEQKQKKAKKSEVARVKTTIN